MREILFRAKREDTGKWIKGMPCATEQDDIYAIQTFQGGIFDIILETLGQFTGFYDKNSKKIFEGDIIKTKYGRLCIVIWFANTAHNGWDLEPVLTAENCRIKSPTLFDLYNKDNLEIIGNIHDNPELLK